MSAQERFSRTAARASLLCHLSAPATLRIPGPRYAPAVGIYRSAEFAIMRVIHVSIRPEQDSNRALE